MKKKSNKTLRTLGKKVQKLRKGIKVSQEELAGQLRISRVYMGYIEQGRESPSLRLLMKLSKKFKVKIENLFYRWFLLFWRPEDSQYHKCRIRILSANNQIGIPFITSHFSQPFFFNFLQNYIHIISIFFFHVEIKSVYLPIDNRQFMRFHTSFIITNKFVAEFKGNFF